MTTQPDEVPQVPTTFTADVPTPTVPGSQSCDDPLVEPATVAALPLAEVSTAAQPSSALLMVDTFVADNGSTFVCEANSSDDGTMLHVHGAPVFLHAETFSGRVAGYVFRVGHRGLGYYRDFAGDVPSLEAAEAAMSFIARSSRRLAA